MTEMLKRVCTSPRSPAVWGSKPRQSPAGTAQAFGQAFTLSKTYPASKRKAQRRASAVERHPTAYSGQGRMIAGHPLH